jgi:small subunit ribosomal protein S19
MAKKIFKYRGKTLEELEAMSLKELSLLFNSRVRRSLNRGLTDNKKKFLKKVEKNKVVKTHLRDVPILPVMVGKKIKVYTGKEFKEITIVPEMIGHLLGEFAPTRKAAGHNNPGVAKVKSTS